MYLPDGRLFTCHSDNNSYIQVQDTQTGQLCDNFIIIPNKVSVIAFSSTMNDQSLGYRLITIYCQDTNTTSFFNIYTSYLYAEFWSQGQDIASICNRTKLIISVHPFMIYDIVDLIEKHHNRYKLNLRDIKDEQMIGQDNKLLFWVPVKHRKNICLLSQSKITWGWSTKLNLSNLRYNNKCTGCIDKEWLKELEDKKMKMTRLLG